VKEHPLYHTKSADGGPGS